MTKWARLETACGCFQVIPVKTWPKYIVRPLMKPVGAVVKNVNLHGVSLVEGLGEVGIRLFRHIGEYAKNVHVYREELK